MKYTRVHVDAIGYELAPVVVTTAEIEERVRPVFDQLRIGRGQVEAWTGIHERRWWEPGYRLSDGAAAAARKALAAAGVEPEQLGAVVYAGVCREQYEPATACRVAALLGAAGDCEVFDVSNACLGVLNGMVELANRIELGQIRAGLVVSAETAREINEVMIERMLAQPTMPVLTQGLATLTGGSGAVAVVLTDGSVGSGGRRRRLMGGVAKAAPQFHELCRWGVQQQDSGCEPYMVTDSIAVLRHGVELGLATWQAFLRELGWSPEQLKVICHQVGSEHREQMLRAFKLSKERDFSTFAYLGNIGTVSLPLTAAMAEQRGFLRSGDRVGFLGIGSGLNCMMLGLEW